MGKQVKEYDSLHLLDKFISDCKRGKRMQKNGEIILPSTIENYTGLRKLLNDFSVQKNFPLRIRSTHKLHARELQTEKNYWEKFYKKFVDYLYDDLDNYDNYVGSRMKLLRAFFNFINIKYLINTGGFQKLFVGRSEQIQIVVLSPERLNHLITSKGLEEKLPRRLKIIKDIFVFGCTVGLRVSDLMKISPSAIERRNDKWYLNVQSQKTQTFTGIKLPPYAVDILMKYIRRKRQRTIFPYYHKVYLNRYIKELCEAAGFTEEHKKRRTKRGQVVIVYKDKEKKTHYRFCDLVTTHTMRRTAVTTLLSLGMDVEAVRTISGHSSGSKEFYRYVKFSQAYLDETIERAHEKLLEKELVEA
ncbi:MAG: tyrosine-type recombinase/integrase [Bacteroidetes bacterium]|nr:tyrosine-type recombinase/integrase [Bacteroidota bacterium]